MIFHAKELTIDTGSNRRLQDIILTMFKYHMGLLPTYLNDIFLTTSLKYNLRTENNNPNFKNCQ